MSENRGEGKPSIDKGEYHLENPRDTSQDAMILDMEEFARKDALRKAALKLEQEGGAQGVVIEDDAMRGATASMRSIDDARQRATAEAKTVMMEMPAELRAQLEQSAAPVEKPKAKGLKAWVRRIFKQE